MWGAMAVRRALLAAGVVTVMYMAGGPWRSVALLTAAAVLIVPGPNGSPSMAAGLIETVSRFLRENTEGTG